jgi:hypothetical protein
MKFFKFGSSGSFVGVFSLDGKKKDYWYSGG